MNMTKIRLLQNGMARESDAPRALLYRDDGRLPLGVWRGTEDEFVVFQAASGELLVYQAGSLHDSLSTGLLIRSAPWSLTFPPSRSRKRPWEDVRKSDQYGEVPLDEAGF
jgi:hypothetical protein